MQIINVHWSIYIWFLQRLNTKKRALRDPFKIGFDKFYDFPIGPRVYFLWSGAGWVLLVVCSNHPPLPELMTTANLNRHTISTNVTLQTFHIQFAPDTSMSFVIQTIDMKFKPRKIVEYLASIESSLLPL